MSSHRHKLINNQRLADIGPALDDGWNVSGPHGIAWLARIAPQARCALPHPCRVEDQP
jgi:hypothetical protein